MQIVKNKNQPISSSNYRSLERTHRVLVEYLWCYILEDQTNWDKWIPYATFVFNAMPHSSTSFTSVELLLLENLIYHVYCRRIPLRLNINYNNYLQELQSRLQSCYKLARANFWAEKEKNREYYDRNTNVPLFVEGEKVLLHYKKVHCCKSVKLSQPWIGPYEIISVDDVNITVILPRKKILKVHANRLKPFFGWIEGTGSQTVVCLCVFCDLFNSHSFGCHCAAI